MNDAEQKVYLRVYARLSDMLAIIECADKQADEYPATLLRELVNSERHAYNVEKDREQREYEERRIRENANQIETLERKTDD